MTWGRTGSDFFNESGSGWSEPRLVAGFPIVDDVVRVQPVDLPGNGTVCVVWSSPWPGDGRRRLRYVDLMGGGKPHLLTRVTNNLGTKTRIEYVPSTTFALRDRAEGRLWVGRLPFPVHVVERTVVRDWIGRSRFVTRYAYRHGHFDTEEREFRGFGMVEQCDTEQLVVLTPDGELPPGEQAAQVLPVHPRTCFHTGVMGGSGGLSRQYEHEYFREPGLDGGRGA